VEAFAGVAGGHRDAEGVSVVIPLYQKAAHVQRALESVLSQTYAKLEVIVVDDGSTDGGGEVVRRCKDSRVKLVTQKNCGAGAARNRGVAEASSLLVAFLDADDEWEKDFLDTVLLLRRRFPEAGAFGTAYRLALPNGEIRLPRFHGRLPRPAGGGLIEYFGGAPGNSPLHSSAVMVRKHALIESGGFAEGVVLGEDHDTWLRLALRHPIAWSWNPAVTHYLDAQNRSDTALYHGSFPFFESVREFRRNKGNEAALPNGLMEYLVRRHTSLLGTNWLAGDRTAMWQIVRDCWGYRAARPRCAGWALLSIIPHPCVRVPWMIWRWMSGRRPVAPQVRSISRPSAFVRSTHSATPEVSGRESKP